MSPVIDTECEVKVLGVGVASLQARLRGAATFTNSSTELLDDRRFDYPAESGRSLKAGGLYLRIRSSETRSEITGKWDRDQTGDVKTVTERETYIDDPEVMEQILINVLGLVVTRSRQKRRTTFHVEMPDRRGCKIEVDKYPEIPPYIEIEARDVATVRAAVELIGFTMDDTTTMTASEVLEHYGADPNFQRFDDESS